MSAIFKNGVAYGGNPLINMEGASEFSNGSPGLVPAPLEGDNLKFLRGDGTWQPVVTSVNGQTEAVNITAISFNILGANEELPSSGTAGTIYFKPNGNTTGTNLYNEWVYVNNAWENLGPVEVNLSNYVTLDGSQSLTNKTINGYTPNAAMAKDVDTSISAGSTSTKLPTSQAVASFVEGKGYGTSNFDGNYSSLSGKPTLGTAAAAATTTSITSGGTGLPTAGAVYTALGNLIQTTTTDPGEGAAMTSQLLIVYSA